jgi:hypothetical protein
LVTAAGDKDDAKRQMHEAIQHFAYHTSLHGAPRIFRSRSLSKRIFWFVVFVGASAMFGFLLSKLLIKYFAYEKRFNIEIRKDTAVFPLITVCNMRPFEASTISRIYNVFSHPRNTTKRLEAAAGNEMLEWLVKLNDAAETLEEQGINLAGLWSPQMLVDLDRAIVERATTQRKDFIIDCFDSVHETTCDENQFVSRLLYDGVFISQCITYNLTQRSHKKRPSPRHKFEWFASIIDGHGLLPPVEISRSRNINLGSKVNGLFGRSLGREGVEVYIHQQDYRANIVNLDRHIFVPPGHMAHFLVTMRSTETSNLPLVSCLREYPFSPHPAGVYAQTSCYYACLQNHIIATCHCKNAELSNDDDYPNVTMCFSMRPVIECLQHNSNQAFSHLNGDPTQSEACDLANAYEVVQNRSVCAKNLLDSEELHVTCDAKCPRACEEVTYDVDVRLIKWPQRNTFVYNVIEKLFLDLSQSELHEDVERLRLYEKYFKVVYDDLDPSDLSHMRFDYAAFASELTVLDVELKNADLVVTQEMSEYTIYQLLSDIGGQLGLCIGMSVITVTEVLELCLNLIKLLCGSRCRR